MVNEVLKQCPFCGGEAETTKWPEGWFIECKEQRCGGTIGAYKTEQEAIEAWNTRAERTCTVQNPSKYLQECSLCGGAVIASDNYCPKCGSKVIRNAD